MTLTRLWHPSPNYSVRLGTVRLIVLHITAGATTNQSLWNFISQPSAQVSYHVSVDNVTPGICFEYVKDAPNQSWSVAAFNPVSVNGAICVGGEAVEWSRQQWLDNQYSAIATLAQWVAEEAQRFSIPLTALSPSQAQGSGRGVCQHRDLGVDGGGHVDCGPNFPMDIVLSLAATDQQPPKPKPTYDEECQSMLVTFGADSRASLPVPANVRAIRFTAGDDSLLNVNWVGSGQSSQDCQLGQQVKADVTIPKGQTGVLLVTRRSGTAPLYCAWIADN